MPVKMLITGGTGLLGSELGGFFSSDYEVFAAGSSDVDIRYHDRVAGFLDRIRPDIVLHCAALADVDRCERENELAFAVNADGTENVAMACRRLGCRMIHYSTDYVFGGEKPSSYVETDATNPVNVYGRSKLEGENRVAAILPDSVILRVAWLYGDQSRSFINRLIVEGQAQLKDRSSGKPAIPVRAVSDRVGCPTWTLEVARQTKLILEHGLRGLFHCTAIDGTSRFELSGMLFEHLSMNVELMSCDSRDFPDQAPRPHFTLLENRRLNDLGLNIMRDYKTALFDFLDRGRA